MVFRTLIGLTYFIIVLILLIPVWCIEWIIGKSHPDAKDTSSLWLIQNIVFRPLLWIIGAHITVYGRENIPDNQPVVYMANHRSMLDCIVLYPLFKGLCGVVSKIEVKKIPFVKYWMDNLYCLYFDRSDMREGLKMILTGIEYLKKGVSICIMPEGTRSHTDEMLPFKEGSMKLATKSGCPIIPVAITGSADLFENHKPWFGPADITVTFGKPIDVKALSRDQQKNLGAHVRDVVGAMLDGGPGHMVEFGEVVKAE
ncbi:MAG: 1-acyl-sn-glycerol-3-phosphate acyltransferase [Lachnospiraceae bacterium]|nr:1-acyl-sn-glycerol-3-phosphate acyltransferase [Lachnospiraceae bacterium]